MLIRIPPFHERFAKNVKTPKSIWEGIKRDPAYYDDYDDYDEYDEDEFSYSSEEGMMEDGSSEDDDEGSSVEMETEEETEPSA